MYVPELKAKLGSCSALCAEGYTINFSRDKYVALKNGIMQQQGRLQEGIYVINGSPRHNPDIGTGCSEEHPTDGIPQAFPALTEKESLRHDRLGHAHVESIRVIARRGAVSGLDRSQSSETDDCIEFIQGKQHKCSLRSSPIRYTRRGEVIKSDVCGPMSVRSLGSARYYVTFIEEESSRYITIIPIARKSDSANSRSTMPGWSVDMIA